MKNPYLFLMLAASAASACAKTGTPDIPSHEREGDGAVTVNVCSCSQTKLTGTDPDDEVKVSSLEVFVFDESGNYLSSDRTEKGSSLTITCKNGKRSVWAVVNAAEIGPVVDVSALRSRAISLSDETPGSFTMAGHLDAVKVDGTTPVELTVDRVVARVVIKSVQNMMDPSKYPNSELKLTGIYLINVQGANNLSLSSFQDASGVWYDKMKQDSGCPVSVLADTGLSEQISYSETYNVPHTFYAYPNDCNYTSDIHSGMSAEEVAIATGGLVTAAGSEWCKRCTRLVVEVSYRDDYTSGYETRYYPVTMSGGFESNRSYEIVKLVISRKGSLSPDIPVFSDDVQFRIDVRDWDVILLGDEGEYRI